MSDGHDMKASMLTRSQLVDLVESVREALWPAGDADAGWTPETIDEVAGILVHYGLRPPGYVGGGPSPSPRAPARLDADRTAKPKSALVARVPLDGRCRGSGPADEYRADTGNVPLHDPDPTGMLADYRYDDDES